MAGPGTAVRSGGRGMGQAKEVVDRWWAAFGSGDFDTLGRLGTPDADIVMPGGMVLRGPEQMRPVLEAYRSAFPDLRHEVVDYVESGDKIAVELKTVGTHTGT